MPSLLPYVRLRPRPDTLHVSQGRTVFECDAEGWVRDGTAHGLYVHQTRLLSRYRWLVDGEPLQAIALSNVEQHSWLGYYVCLPDSAATHQVDLGSGQMEEVSEHTLELRLARYVGDGVHEDVDLANYTARPVSIRLALEVDADFAGREELHLGSRRQLGELRRAWRGGAGGADDGELVFSYTAEHRYDRQGNRGAARIDRALALTIRGAGSPPRWTEGHIEFDVALAPLERWHACIDLTARIEDRVLRPAYSCRSFSGTNATLDRLRRRFLDDTTSFEVPGRDDLAVVVAQALDTAKRDLASLRLTDLDRSETQWTMAAGLPVYIALFGRDTLTTAWQAALAGPEMMEGTLRTLADWQGTEDNPWRDEQPGRMLHEAHTDPLAALHYNPRSRYYGAITTSAFYPVAMSELWHWTGDLDRVYPLLKPALDAVEWLDSDTDLRGDGFHYYRSRSVDGNVHQGWKDSGEGIVDAAGRPVEPPIATCEEQGFVYAAKLQLAEILWRVGRRDHAKRLYHAAGELKRRFNERFWMEDLRFFAMGLDADGEPIRSIGSNAGHCLATGIVDAERAEAVADRLMAPDLWSGWGVRTLSAANPAYNPYSYHRGSIWPVENGTFALAFFRFGLWDHLERLARALFEAAALYDFRRLPEVFGGHPRDDDHPFPAIYPKANWPQAWSASALFCVVQAMLGLYPYAPLRLLLVDPHLPAWLPELTLRGLRVGAASVTLHCRRRESGKTELEVVEKEGEIRVVRQPSPWSLTAGLGERARDALESLLRQG
jgi:glycogen debranching enzyme